MPLALIHLEIGMSPNKNKIKGSTWERDVTELLNTKIHGAHFKRIAGSGAIGTTMGESLLTGDVTGSIPGIPKKFKAECKTGYSNKTDAECKSLAVQKEWLDKIKKEAETAYSYPMFLGKFQNVRQGVRYFVAFDFDTFVDMMNYVADLKQELDSLYEKFQNSKK
jgi:hypothetical protein